MKLVHLRGGKLLLAWNTVDRMYSFLTSRGPKTEREEFQVRHKNREPYKETEYVLCDALGDNLPSGA